MLQVRIDVHGARLMATVDGFSDETHLKGLDKENNYGVSANLTSVVLIGGITKNIDVSPTPFHLFQGLARKKGCMASNT